MNDFGFRGVATFYGTTDTSKVARAHPFPHHAVYENLPSFRSNQFFKGFALFDVGFTGRLELGQCSLRL